MLRCPLCDAPIARRDATTRDSFACPRCAAQLEVPARTGWITRVLCGLFAGAVAGLVPFDGAGLFAGLVGAAVAISEQPFGAPRLSVASDTRRAGFGLAVLRGVAVGLCAAVPYALVS